MELFIGKMSTYSNINGVINFRYVFKHIDYRYSF